MTASAGPVSYRSLDPATGEVLSNRARVTAGEVVAAIAAPLVVADDVTEMRVTTVVQDRWSGPPACRPASGSVGRALGDQSWKAPMWCSVGTRTPSSA
jgi:hypothetical protein